MRSATRAIVGVTAGASAPEDLVEAVIAKLAPTHGVDAVRVTDEDEYFPPPRELRELIPALDAVAAFAFGGDPQQARERGGPLVDDRSLDASAVLEALGSLGRSARSFASSNVCCNASAEPLGATRRPRRAAPRSSCVRAEPTAPPPRSRPGRSAGAAPCRCA